MLEVQAIAVELTDPGRGDHDAMRVGEFEDVEGEEEGLAEWGHESVVRRSCEG